MAHDNQEDEEHEKTDGALNQAGILRRPVENIQVIANLTVDHQWILFNQQGARGYHVEANDRPADNQRQCCQQCCDGQQGTEPYH